MSNRGLTALVLGHSFTRRLSTWLVSNHVFNFNVDSGRLQVFLHGLGGATVLSALRDDRRSVWREASLVRDLEANIVVLDIGSNDLCRPGIEPNLLVQSIFSFIQLCRSYGASSFVVMEILPRTGRARFNDRAAHCNRLLASMCLSLPDVYFWTHSRNNFCRRFLSDYVSRDGDHVDVARGMHRYFMSVRGALLMAERHLLSP